ncbi:MAG: DUF554 domain-containing protein [Candidatus Izimaplasma sp.]|nr:DUF554 domain-containing protein [Candidatus Izimaplasma bacterium]
MFGVIVNGIAIILGGVIGLFLNKGLPEKVKRVIMQAIGLSVLLIGFSSAILTNQLLLLVMSLVFGGIIGVLIGIEDKLNALGKKIESQFKEGNNFAQGFVMATLVYCIGAMAIVGSLEAGFGDNTTLYVKSILDGVTAIIFTATLGYGVIFSSVVVVIYQGSIVLLGSYLAPFLTTEIITEISAVGGLLIVGIGINILEIKQIHVGDLLPAVFIPPLWFLIVDLLQYI